MARRKYIEVEVNTYEDVPVSEVLDALDDDDLLEEAAKRNLHVLSVGDIAEELRTRILARDWVGALAVIDRICEQAIPPLDLQAKYDACPKYRDISTAPRPADDGAQHS